MSPIQELAQAMHELHDVRESAIGKPIVNYEAAAELLALRRPWLPLANMHLMNGEKRACAVFDTFAQLGIEPVVSVLGTDITRIAPEFNVGRGRVDRAVFHESGRLSLVEIKSAVSTRDVVAGIGQALMYAAQAERMTDCSPIVPVLAVLGEYDEDVARACERGGVEYIALGGIGWLKLLSQLTEMVTGR